MCLSVLQCRKDRSRQRRLDFVAIFIDSRDICAQDLRPIDLNYHV